MSNELKATSKKVERFEDLIAWQKSRELAGLIYTLTRSESFRKDLGLSGQLQRAAVSIMSNLAEGFERGSAADFHRFIIIAKASCAEVRSHLYIALDIGYLAQNDFRGLITLAEEVSRILGGLKTSVAKKASKSR